MNNGFAQLSDFERQTEAYTFSAWIYLNQESILIGIKASIVIRPSLLINNREASLDILKNTKVTLTTMNYIDSIPVTKTFENLKIKGNKELVLDFQVPAYLSSVSVQIETELFNVTKQTKDKFTEQKTFNIQIHNYSYEMSELYLRKEKGNHMLYLLGKNGEPKPQVNLKVKLMHPQLLEYCESKSFNLKTDKEGCVKLGPLKKIIGISAKVSALNIDKNFMINHTKQSLTYPNAVDAIENDTLEFPVLFKNKKRTKISLIRKTESYVLEDLYDKIEFVKQEDKDYNLVRIQGLSDGKYILNIKSQCKLINITINRGQYWEGDSFILKKTCLFENTAQIKMVKVANVKVEENKEGTKDVTIKLDDFSKDTRVHVIANQFQQPFPILQFISMNKLVKKSIVKAVFTFAQWNNIFMSNRELSDEFRYVFDRKYAERFQGNTLERPRLVLKRTYFGPTQINTEVLNQGTNYQQQDPYDMQIFCQNVAPKAQMIQNSIQPIFMQQNCQLESYNAFDMKMDIAYGRNERNERNMNNVEAMLEDLMSSDHEEGLKISEFQNFLHNPPLAMFNLVPNSEGLVKFSQNLAPFTQLQVLVVDNNSVAQRTIDLDVNPTQKRDLSLKKTLDCEKGFTESRTTETILQGQMHFIEDITSTEIQLIDDLTKVKGVLEELMKSNGSNSGVYRELIPIIIQWPKIKNEEKLKILNKHFCHEMNLFIYFKDRTFFDSTVKPFLQCKMEKTFIDFYLLGQYDQLLPYATIESNIISFDHLDIETLNALELALLVEVLTRKEMKDEAQRVVDFIKIKCDSTTHNNVNQNNRDFDTVLNLNIMKAKEEGAMLGGGGSQPNLSYPSSSFAPSAIQSQIPMPRSMPHHAIQNRMRQRSYSESEESDCYDDDECEQEGSYEMAKPMKRMAKKKVAYKEKSHINDARKQLKQKAKMNFEEIQQTSQYVETNYYKQTNQYQSQVLVVINKFWVDYVEHIAAGVKDKLFLTSSFIKNASNHLSSLLTFALLDLPFESVTHNYKTTEGRGVEITASSPIIMFKKEVKEAKLELTNDILVTHRYVSLTEQSGTSAAMPDEFLVNKVYQCEVIMTNVSPQQKNFSVLYQIPQGSLPLQMTKYMKSQPQSLSPYTTLKSIFYFYFPAEGTFTHFPSNIAEEDKVVARAQTHQLKVVTRLSVNKKETFKDIVQSGSKDDILEFIKTHNLLKGEKGYCQSYILWMLKDPVFFKKVVSILRQKFIFSSDIWKFALLHKDEEQAIVEYLSKNTHVFSELGNNFSSKLLTIKPQFKNVQHFDYYPMLNSRAHLVGETENWTLNATVKQDYEKTIVDMAAKKELDNFDKIKLVYFFQLQDRVTEAIQIFKTIDIESLEGTLRVQYDYMNAYFDFFTGESESFKTARAIVRKYEDYPIPQWRILFLEILDQLNEYDGEADEEIEVDGEIMTEEQKKQKYKQSIKKEPRLQVEVSSEQSNITIDLANIKQLVVKFYIIDAEILFSRTPFLQKSTDEFSYVKPCHVIEQELHNPDLNSSVDTVTYLQQGQKFDLAIPEHLKNQNMVIEINGDEKQVFKTYYSTQINVSVLESYGELKVTDKNGQALSKVYVKVYAQKKGGSTSQPFFFRDGYTDIRGKFEYAQTSGNRLNEVQKFAIFVMSDTLGSIIKECNPPKIEATNANPQEEPVINQRKEQRIISKVANWRARK